MNHYFENALRSDYFGLGYLVFESVAERGFEKRLELGRKVDLVQCDNYVNWTK